MVKNSLPLPQTDRFSSPNHTNNREESLQTTKQSCMAFTLFHFTISHFTISHFTISHFTISHFTISHFLQTPFFCTATDIRSLSSLLSIALDMANPTQQTTYV
jgi:hypothetical protein